MDLMESLLLVTILHHGQKLVGDQQKALEHLLVPFNLNDLVDMEVGLHGPRFEKLRLAQREKIQ